MNWVAVTVLGLITLASCIAVYIACNNIAKEAEQTNADNDYTI